MRTTQTKLKKKKKYKKKMSEGVNGIELHWPIGWRTKDAHNNTPHLYNFECKVAKTMTAECRVSE